MVASPREEDTNHIVRGTQAVASLPSFTSSSAGLTYCAIGSLAFLDHTSEGSVVGPDGPCSLGISSDECTRWIIGRQTTYLEEEESEIEEQTSHVSQPEAIPLPSSPLGSPHASHFPATPLSLPEAPVSARMQSAEAPVLNLSKGNIRWAGFNGRPNKIADTCYCFWNTGALAVRILSLPESCPAD